MGPAGTLTASTASAATKLGALGCLLLGGWAELFPRRTLIEGRPRGATMLDLAHLVLTLASCAAYAAKGSLLWSEAFMSDHRRDAAPYDVIIELLSAMTVALLGALSLRRYFTAQHTSGFVFIVSAVLAVASATDFLELRETLDETGSSTSDERGEWPVQNASVFVEVALLFLTLGNATMSALRDTLVWSSRSRKYQLSNEEQSRCPVAVLTGFVVYRNLCSFLTSSAVILKDFPPASLRMLTAPLVKKVFSYAPNNSSQDTGKRKCLFIWGLVRALWLDIFWTLASNMTYAGCAIVRTLVLESLITGTSDMAAMMFLFAATCVGEAVFVCIFSHYTLQFNERLLILTQGAIFRSALRFSPSSRSKHSTSKVTSVLSVDCPTLSLAAQLLSPPITNLALAPLAVYILASRVGTTPAHCSTAWPALVMLLSGALYRLQERLQKRNIQHRDQRVVSTMDVLSSIRTVKMNAWERTHLERIQRVRERELKDVLAMNVLNSFQDAFRGAAGAMMILVMYATLRLVNPGRVLNAAESFTAIYLLSLIEAMVFCLSITVRMGAAIAATIGRIAELCTADEDCKDSRSENLARNGEVILEKCTFTRTTTDELCKPCLQGVDLHVQPGTLAAVVGFVGSGKSTLLSAILGELNHVEGTVGIGGSLGYVPQVAAVFKMSLRDNVLFGKPYDPELYRRVLEACDLVQDIASFPAGDLTEVGDKAYNLSGGQKQRVSLARAAYQQCSIYLLDDPLSALDPHVSSRVFKRLLGKSGLLGEKTRIMVTSQGHLFRHADQLYLMRGRSGVSYVHLWQLLEDPYAPDTLQVAAVMGQTREVEKSADVVTTSTNSTKENILHEESSLSVKSTLSILWSTFKLGGVCFPLAVLLMAASAAVSSWQFIWVKQWTDSRDPLNVAWLWGIAAFAAGTILFRAAGNCLFSWSLDRLSRLLHHRMMEHVLLSPMSFFDVTPRGTILNRFTTDLNDIDTRFAVRGRQAIQTMLLVLSQVAVLGTESTAVVAVSVTVVAGFTCGMGVLTRASNVVRFLRTTLFSKLLQHVTETMESLSLVRTFGATERCYARFCRLADQNARATSAWLACNRILRIFTTACGLLIVLVTLGSVVGDNSGPPNGSAIGVALSSSLSIPLSMIMLCGAFLSITQVMVALERDLEYTELPMEEDVKPKSSLPRSAGSQPPQLDTLWPAEGSIEFQEFSASYRPGELEDCLKRVTFAVRPREKMGIVGRTGAGKSSLVLALLRVLKSTGGRILIDGVDIASVPLPRLRSAITAIAQDPALVCGTLRENLDPTGEHSDDDLWRVLQQAHLEKFVRRHTDGLLLKVGDGGENLSAGQRQLVCLARALLRRPRVLVLDEATSQMDGDTDRLIQATIRESFGESTVLTVAHRIHTVLDYDTIMVMDGGRIVENAPLNELLSNCDSKFSAMAAKAGVAADRYRNGHRMLHNREAIRL